jgi:hypothetical protein
VFVFASKITLLKKKLQRIFAINFFYAVPRSLELTRRPDRKGSISGRHVATVYGADKPSKTKRTKTFAKVILW